MTYTEENNKGRRTEMLPDLSIEQGKVVKGMRFVQGSEGEDPSLKDKKARKVKCLNPNKGLSGIMLACFLCLTVFPFIMQFKNYATGNFSQADIMLSLCFYIPGLTFLIIALRPFIKRKRLESASCDTVARIEGYVRNSYRFNGYEVFDMYMTAETRKGSELICCTVLDRKPYKKGRTIQIGLLGRNIRFKDNVKTI